MRRPRNRTRPRPAFGPELLESRDTPSFSIAFDNAIPGPAANGQEVYVYLYGNDQQGGPTRQLAVNKTTGDVTLATLGSTVPAITFADIPVDPTTKLPTIHLGEQWIDSARIYFSVGSELNIPVNGTTVTNPAPTTPTYDGTVYDWVEFTLDGTQTIYINTTQVDQFGLPIGMTIAPKAANPADTVGVPGTRDDTFAAYRAYLAAAPADAQAAFGSLLQLADGSVVPYTNTTAAPIRLLSPQDAIARNLAPAGLLTYFNGAIDSLFTKYTSTGTTTFTMTNVNGAPNTGVNNTGLHTLSGYVDAAFAGTNIFGRSDTYRVLRLTDTSGTGAVGNGDQYTVFAPFFATNSPTTGTGTPVTTTATVPAGLNYVTVASPTGIEPGMLVTGTGIAANTLVTGVTSVTTTTGGVTTTTHTVGLLSPTSGPPGSNVPLTFARPDRPAPPAVPGTVISATAAGANNATTITVTPVQANQILALRNQGATVTVTGPGIALNNVVTGVALGTDGQPTGVVNLAAPNLFAFPASPVTFVVPATGQNATATPSAMAIAAEGVFADSAFQFYSNPTRATLLGSAENLISSAINRGIGLNPYADWRYTYQDQLNGVKNPFFDPANSQNPGKVWNYYMAFLHERAVNGLAYANAYDDQGGFSTTLAESAKDPAVVLATITLQPITAAKLTAVGAGAGGGPRVVLAGPERAERASFFAYGESFSGGVRVAVGDVNGDGVPDTVTGPGAGGGPHIKVLSGRDGSELASFFAFESTFTGGVYVAAGDVNGDGYADVIVGAGAGGGPRVRVFSGKDGSPLADLFAFDPAFRGGVTVAAGDADADGRADLVVGAGAGDRPVVRVLRGADFAELRQFLAYETGFTGGVFVAVGDVTADGVVDIVTAPGVGGGPLVRVFDGRTGDRETELVHPDPTSRGGATVGVSGDGPGARVVVGAGPGGPPAVSHWDPVTGELVTADAVAGGFLGGVFVAG